MGLDFRKKSGRIANGSKLVVPGQITTGQKVFPNTFSMKSRPAEPKLDFIPVTPTPTPNPTPSVTPTNTITPTPSVTPTITPTNTGTPTPTPSSTQPPTPELFDPIIAGLDTYILVGVNEYLMY